MIFLLPTSLAENIEMRLVSSKRVKNLLINSFGILTDYLMCNDPGVIC